MSILDALKKLITKRGGTAKGSNIAEVINNYANEDSPSPSGGGALIVDTEFINNGGYEVYYRTNVLAADIEAAYKAGKNVIIHFQQPDEGFFGQESTLTIGGWVDNKNSSDGVNPYTILLSNDNIGAYYDPIGFGRLQIADDGYLLFYMYVD